jgi:hypothetical protein
MSHALLVLSLIATFTTAAFAAPPPEYAAGGPGWWRFSPRATFYRTNSDPCSEPAQFFLLEELPFRDVTKPLTIEVFGDYASRTGVSEAITTPQALHGVFTKTPTLLAPNLQKRLPDALRVNSNTVITAPTYKGAQATDIPEDFRFTVRSPTKFSIAIPAGAKWIALSVPDSYYSDNADADDDLWIRFSRQ